MDDIRTTQDAALERAKDAVASALAAAPGAAKRPAADSKARPDAKKQRRSLGLYPVDDGLSSESEDEEGVFLRKQILFRQAEFAQCALPAACVDIEGMSGGRALM